MVQKGLNGDLELPPVADAQTRMYPFELFVWTVGGNGGSPHREEAL